MRKVLNVGGNSKEIPLPSQYAGWEHVLLDIDPKGQPDVVCDARELHSLPKDGYESIHCSHNLEHYYHHEVPKVLAGFAHVLKPNGFAYIRVPDMWELMKVVVQNHLDIGDVLYHTTTGQPITARDVIYGWGIEIERNGNDFMAHKTGFTQKVLREFLSAAGFPWVFTTLGKLEILAIAFKDKPDEYATQLFQLPRQ